jgi:hypothetical protein
MQKYTILLGKTGYCSKNIRSVVRLRKYLFVSVIIIVLFVLLKVRYFLIGLVHPFVYILKPI